MDITFSGKIWYWRGPAPFYFVSVPAEEGLDIKSIANRVTYGWGVIPVVARIGQTEWRTSLFPKDGSYIVPIKASVRAAESLDVDDTVTLSLNVRPAPGRFR